MNKEQVFKIITKTNTGSAVDNMIEDTRSKNKYFWEKEDRGALESQVIREMVSKVDNTLHKKEHSELMTMLGEYYSLDIG